MLKSLLRTLGPILIPFLIKRIFRR